jgi:hypothetical protein
MGLVKGVVGLMENQTTLLSVLYYVNLKRET